MAGRVGNLFYLLVVGGFLDVSGYNPEKKGGPGYAAVGPWYKGKDLNREWSLGYRGDQEY